MALLLSLGVACLVWFPLGLAGSWALFWFTYFLTTVIGVGARSNPGPKTLLSNPLYWETFFPSQRDPTM